LVGDALFYNGNNKSFRGCVPNGNFLMPTNWTDDQGQDSPQDPFDESNIDDQIEWENWLNGVYTGRTYSGDALNEKGMVIDVPRHSEDYISNKAIHEPQIKIPKKSQIGITLLGLFIVSKVL